AEDWLVNMANGDARQAITMLENTNELYKKITKENLKNTLQSKFLRYDKAGEEHYNIISALHKSMRGSDANAALYWLARMFEAGEDPLYIARRLVRFASEDIGLANSKALEQAVAAYHACHFIGAPECNVILAQAVVYMAKCKKSNELYTAYQKAKKDVEQYGNLPVPLHLRNAPTKLMKEIGYGKDYKYSPDYNYQESQEYLPEKLKGRKYFKK
ncbi:replication-associated recombination protein A, partial [Patescibacteria group bacterium]|nr:replication-associated recombination protein A [Patescibacteria group bacterium]